MGNSNIVNGDDNLTNAGDNNLNVRQIINNAVKQQVESLLQSRCDELKSQIKNELTDEIERQCRRQDSQIKKIDEMSEGLKTQVDDLQNQGIDGKIDEKLNPLRNRLEDDINPKISVLQKHKKIIIIFLAASIILGIIVLCVSLCAFSIDSMAFLGWAMSILSLLVVVLMGWQIFNVLDLKEYRNAISSVDVLKDGIEQFKEQLINLKKSATAEKVAFENKVKDLEQKYKQLNTELLPDIYEAKGLACENIDIERAIVYYLEAVEIMVGELDRVQSPPGIRSVYSLWSKSDDIKRIFKISPNINESMKRIMRHPNCTFILGFDNFVIKVDDYINNRG